MQLALVGLPGAGVKTIFSAITGQEGSLHTSGPGGMYRLASVKVPDERLDFVAQVFQPKKKVQETVELVEYPGLFGQKTDPNVLGKARLADALVLVLRTFPSMTVPHIKGSVDPKRDLDLILTELLLSDLSVAESRLVRLEASLKKRKDEKEEAEREVLQRCKATLDDGKPLREAGLSLQDEKLVRGFGFLTLKPLILLLNIGDSQLGSEDELALPFEALGVPMRCLCGDVEAELLGMAEEDRSEFMQEFGIEELAAPVVLAATYQTLDLVTFFTYGENECRAWSIRSGETAVDAAAKIHTDLARGFIRAEVVAFEDLQEFGSLREVKNNGRFRLEGKDYVVHDGDLIIIRHSS